MFDCVLCQFACGVVVSVGVCHMHRSVNTNRLCVWCSSCKLFAYVRHLLQVSACLWLLRWCIRHVVCCRQLHL
jgi:hypothetical protein